MTMKAYAYIYTRTLHIDYNVFTMPSSQVLASSVAEDFEKKISGILCIDDRKELAAPQYVYVRNSNIVLWGIAILNNVLFGNSEYSKDHVARPIRSFIGIILTDPSPAMSLPMDMDFFAQLYQEQIFPLWKNRFLEPQETEISMPSNGTFLSPQSNIEINTDKDVLRVFNGSKFSEQVLSACLAYDGDVSIATNVHSIDRVALSRFNPFTNVVLSQEKETAIEDIPVKHICPNCQREVPYSEIKDGYCDSCRPRVVVEEAEEPEVPLYECKKCHNMFESLDSHGYCSDCAEKRKLQRYIQIAIVIAVLLFSFFDYSKLGINIPKVDVPSFISSCQGHDKKEKVNGKKTKTQGDKHTTKIIKQKKQSTKP